MARKESQLCRKYHSALVRAIGDRVEQVKSKVASDWTNQWKESIDTPIRDPLEFEKAYREFLEEELSFADHVDVSAAPGRLDVEVDGCIICEGNEMLRQTGEQTFCPIIPTGMFALLRVHGRRATLEGVEKPGPVGSCRIHYRVDDS